MRKIAIVIGTLLCSFLIVVTLVSCNKKDKDNNNQNNDIVTRIIEESAPKATVEVGEYESIITDDFEDVSDDLKTSTSTTIFDMPKNGAINLVYSNDDNRSLQSVSTLMSNIVEANNDTHMISITDRNGKYKNNALSATTDKIIISSPNGFDYGEVYQIELNDVDYLSFEGKDTSIRKLTIEIEDDPSEESTYNIKEIKSGIVVFDRDKITNKKINSDNLTYSFEYNGSIPEINNGDLFYATGESGVNSLLDFYGLFIESKTVSARTIVTYSAPNLDDIYNSFHLKGEQALNLSNSDILLTEDFVVQEFKQSGIAEGLVNTLLEITPQDVETILEILKHININVNVNIVDNRVSMKIILKLSSFKIADDKYIGFEIGYENITDYILDFDVKISYTWKFPTGVDYKIKCVEDSFDAFYFKFLFDKQEITEEDESQTDYELTNKLIDEIGKALDGKSSVIGGLVDETTGSSVSGTKVTFPLLQVNFLYLTPLQIKFNIDFYFDIGFEAVGLIKYQKHTTKVDFCFSNISGDGQDSSFETDKTSNLVIYAGGSFHAEVGLRASFGISLLGLYDYLHAEAYAEAYMNFTLAGMIAANIDFTNNTEFSGYYAIDANLTVGVRAGFNFKAIIVSSNIQKTWATSLFRVKFDNPLEHWSDDSQSTIDMSCDTLDLNDTNVLWVKYFDSIAFALKEKKFDANYQFSIVSGYLAPDWLVISTTGNTFKYTAEDSSLLEISEDGVIHIKPGTAKTFTTHITISVPNFVGFIEDKIIKINYTATDTKDVYAGDELIAQERTGYKITLPEAPKIEGKGFMYYLYNDQKYYAGDEFTVPSESVSFELVYRDLPIYNVYFYDGYGILVAIDNVYEGDDAIEPNARIRDRYMDAGWQFYYWDTNIKNVQRDLHVSGTYARMG